MQDEDRIDQLEQRLARVERLVEGLAGKRGSGEVPSQGPALQPRGPVAPPSASPHSHIPASPLSSEQWIGQRLLLAIGVIALILAAGYLLRLSFERGWISPLMRCVGGACAGIIVGALGWRLQPRYRTYGAALIGCGAAIIYLSVWAAARLYGVVPPAPGIVGLALVSVSLAMIAYAIDVEALGTTAALGALFAPLLLGRDYADADLLLLYLACMAAGLGYVAARRRWRRAIFVVALSFFGIGYAGSADRGNPWSVLLYGLLGGSTGIHIGLRERWWETRFLSFSGGWTFVAAASRQLERSWAVLLGALVLAAPVWWYALRTERVLLLPLTSRQAVGAWSLGEVFYFLATPPLVGWAVHQLSPQWFDVHPGLVALLLAIPYLIVGYQRPRFPFALVGAAALGIAVWQHWSGVPRVWGLLGLVLLWAALDHRYSRDDGRWYALATLWAALHQLLGDALAARPIQDPAFVGSWPLALWGTAAVCIALAAGLWRRIADASTAPLVRVALWTVAGAAILFGVTGEIGRYFTAALASGLAVSAWWLVFAATLVGAGFRHDLKPARVAGLAVAGLAVIKVLLYDLSSLDALYRVGSVFILGLVFLLLAYLYHRQGRGQSAEPGKSTGL